MKKAERDRCIGTLYRCEVSLARFRELSARAKMEPIVVKDVILPLFSAVEDLHRVLSLILEGEMD